MRSRLAILALGGAIGAAVALAHPADAQVVLCERTGFSATSGTTACSGTAKPVTVTANVKTYARLSLEQVFGSPAASLAVAMGDVDSQCISVPAPGVTCASDAPTASATWFGDIAFRVKLAGLGTAHAKITGLRPSTGTIPAGRLLDGAAGSTPGLAYPVAPATPADLQTALGAGDTLVSRSLGLKVTAADPPGAWSGNTVYSLVIE